MDDENEMLADFMDALAECMASEIISDEEFISEERSDAADTRAALFNAIQKARDARVKKSLLSD